MGKYRNCEINCEATAILKATGKKQWLKLKSQGKFASFTNMSKTEHVLSTKTGSNYSLFISQMMVILFFCCSDQNPEHLDSSVFNIHHIPSNSNS